MKKLAFAIVCMFIGVATVNAESSIDNKAIDIEFYNTWEVLPMMSNEGVEMQMDLVDSNNIQAIAHKCSHDITIIGAAGMRADVYDMSGNFIGKAYIQSNEETIPVNVTPGANYMIIVTNTTTGSCDIINLNWDND